MKIFEKRNEILVRLYGKWISEDDFVNIVFKIIEPINPESEAFLITGKRKLSNCSDAESFNINFHWTDAILHAFYKNKQCVVSFCENEDTLGFFNSETNNNGIINEELLIRFKKV